MIPPLAEPIAIESHNCGHLVKVKCPYCKRTHEHTLREPSDASHRAAPCGKGTYDIRAAMPDQDDYGDHVLYRFYDEADELLYVGITYSPAERFKAHRSLSQWWSQAAKVTMTRYLNRRELAEAEIKAIKSENPRYNRTYAERQPRPRPTEKPIRKLRSSNAKRGDQIHPHASAFQAPDAIARDDYQPPQEKLPLAEANRPLALPCPDCNSRVHEEPDGLVKCNHCLNMWLYDEWAVLVGIKLPPLSDEAADE